MIIFERKFLISANTLIYETGLRFLISHFLANTLVTLTSNCVFSLPNFQAELRSKNPATKNETLYRVIYLVSF
jgi:hypothetical protein